MRTRQEKKKWVLGREHKGGLGGGDGRGFRGIPIPGSPKRGSKEAWENRL